MLLAAFSCDDEDFKNDSTLKATNPTITVNAPFGNNVTFLEKDTTFTFTVTLSEPQIVDVAVYVSVGAGTATLGSDFSLGSDRIVIPAWRTSASGSISVTNDTEVEESETIIVTVGDERTANAQITPVTFNFTVEDADVPPPSELEFALSWAYADEVVAGLDACDNDVDITIQTPGGDPYDDDLFEYALSTTSCPEHGTFLVETMEEGVEYEVWVFFYGGANLGDLSGVTVNVDFARNDSDFGGSIEIAGEFDSRQGSAGLLLGTLERTGEVVSFKDGNGDVISEGRVRGLKKITSVKKPL